MMVTTGYRAGFDAHRCEYVSGCWVTVSTLQGRLNWLYSDSMQTHTHTRASVHAHFHMLISADGHHNAKSRSQQFSSLPLASWPRRVQRLSARPGLLSQPPQHLPAKILWSHGTKNKQKNPFFFSMLAQVWQWWWFSATPEGPSD